MAYYGLLPGQKMIGGYAPPGAGGLRDGNIIVIEIADAPKVRGTPRLAFFTYQAQSAGTQGYPDAKPPVSDANIVVDWDPVTKKYVYMKVPLPNTVLVDIYTVRNDAENNEKYKDIAFNGFEYVPINTDYRVDKQPITSVPGVGIAFAGYYLTGGIKLEENTLFVSGHGTRHTPVYDGVDFWMTATVLINGEVFAKQALKRSGGHELVPEHGISIGSATFNLPEPVAGQKTQLLLEGSFSVSTPEGNGVMPSATFEQIINIRAKTN